MASSYIIIFALALFVELTTRSMALPKFKMDEEHTDQERMVSVTGEDDISELGPGQLPFRRHPIIEGRLVDEDGTKRIFILADTGIKGGREGNLAFSRTFSELLPHGLEHALDGFSTMDEQRNVEDVIPVGRRDIDMLRCMVGRVYRPCWQA
ncbi:pro-MCH precursor [Danio rerio]|uniref:Pro-MCH precursor n=1 Tax=Danio rerio TaxID=7955 RepID=C9W8C3_DANRE|nr:pro-MCH precursor [Danio rerio]ACO35934.1 pro-melanin-concentrating hormone 2 [Danio rerio]|eukprot:NP_001189471.1 pro-MCH precursor [Danio rerio]